MKEALLDYGPAVLTWVEVAYKLPSVRRAPRNVGRWSLWLTLCFLALAATVLVPPIYAAVDHLLGRPNLARLLSNSLTLCACWAVLSFLAHLSGAANKGKVVWWMGLFLGAVLLAMAVLFLSAPVYPEALDFPERYAAAPHVLQYRLVFLLYVGITDVTMTRLCWRYSQEATRVSLRLGLRIIMAGGVAGLLYVLNDASYLIAVRLSIAYPLTDPVTIHQILVALVVILPVIGCIIPALGPRVDRYRALRRLYPLWVALCRSCPEIALEPPPSLLTDALNIRDLDFRLHRRVVEIRDGSLAVRRYADSGTVELAARLSREAILTTEEAMATVQAAIIVAGQWTKSQGHPQPATPIHLAVSKTRNLEGEVAELEVVARCYTRSPVIRAIRAQLAKAMIPDGNAMCSPSDERDDEGAWQSR